MELTIQQALQQGIEAHRAGNFRDAEVMYRAILQVQPKHPDANHNLGVLLVSSNKTANAIPFFKIALEADPNQGQFWISYVEAFIKTNQHEIAMSVLRQGKKLGLAGERVDALEVQLTCITVEEKSESTFKKKTSSFTQQPKKILGIEAIKNNSSPNQKNPNQLLSPSQTELISLLEHYQNGRLDLAENLAKSVTLKYPNHQFSWKVLGSLFHQTGRLKESLIANQTALALLPNDEEVHINLGNTLKELGRLEEAEASYKKAISIKPSLVYAHSNLGLTLQKLGRLEEAEASYKKSLAINPAYATAHINLGITLKELGRLEEAEESYKKAIAIIPEYPEAHYNLGNTRQQLGRLDDAEESYKKAIAIKPDYPEAYYNLGNTLKELGRLEDAEASYKRAVAIMPEHAQAHSNLGLVLRELGRLEDAEASYNKAITIKSDLAEPHINLGATLQELGRLESAEESYKRAIAIKPDYAQAHSNLGDMLLERGRLEEAEASYAQAIRLKPDFIHARNEMLTCLYLMDKKSIFFNELDYLIKQDKASAVIGSLTCRAALRYGEKKPNIFCNKPLEHVLIVDLKSRCNFEEIFVKNINSILAENKRSSRKQNLLLNGYQTSGNLFDKNNNFTDEIEKTIRSEIERYRIKFQNSDEGLIKKWQKDYTLNGWIISMRSGGELHPHIHNKGWLSGSIYINVPPKSKIDSGNLVVALGKDGDTTNSFQNSKKVLNVVTGNLVLFPASLMHYTIPFESKENRIVLAFDVIFK